MGEGVGTGGGAERSAATGMEPPSMVGSLAGGSVEHVRAWLATADAAAARLDDGERIELIAALESLKGAAAAAQAAVTVAFADSQDAAQEAAGVPRTRRGEGVGAQIALARRESPHRGSRHLGLAKALVREMPATYAALQAGRITEWAATLVAQATACLSADDRRRVDAALTPQLGTVSDTRLARAANALAYEADPAAIVARARRAHTERRVTVRPAPDTMAYLTALLPVTEAVGCYAALTRVADAAIGGGRREPGDGRTRGQVMADELVARVTGTNPHVQGQPVAVGLIMSDTTMTGDSDESGQVSAPGVVPCPIPAALARRLALTGSLHEEIPCTPDQHAWIRRLFTSPTDGSLIQAESTARVFTGALRALVIARDQTCATPWCDAPIRHADHVTRHADSGVTSLDDGQGLCEACNYTKEIPQWSSTTFTLPDGTRIVRLTTPAGKTYDHRAPPALDILRAQIGRQRRDGPAPPLADTG